MRIQHLGWALFIVFAIGVGLYPSLYWLVDMSHGLLSSKLQEVLQNQIWHTAFYLHISFGGLSLLTGWSQFSKRLRTKKIGFHRALGKIYVTAVLISGTAALYIATYATGGIIAELGFGGLAIAWLTTTSVAYRSIRSLQIRKHQQWMIRSYALTFAAVTLRLWLPTFQFLLDIDFLTSYKIISWLCWVPNLLVGEWIARRVMTTTVVPTKTLR